MNVELSEDEQRSFRQGFLLTTQEKKLAKAKAEAHKLRAQVERAKAEAESAKKEAHELREHIIASSTKLQVPSLRKILSVTAISLLSAAVLRISYLGYTRPSATLSEAVALPISSDPPPKHTVVTHKPPAPGDQRFKLAMLRLQDDLGSLPEDEMQIVKEVNERHPFGPRPCPLEWVNGEAALSLDANNEMVPPSLLAAVERCAAAVEQFSELKNAAAARQLSRKQ